MTKKKVFIKLVDKLNQQLEKKDRQIDELIKKSVQILEHRIIYKYSNFSTYNTDYHI